tara:strand:+ start:57 stop:563 length:507 start_codon:yes stop_codon:yes gene_type:complete
MTNPLSGAQRYPRLPNELRNRLSQIEPTQAIYYPALVTLRTGELRDAVYLCPAAQWFEKWGVWPEEDTGKKSVPLEEVADLEESPSRLPRELAETIYAAGESGMGYHLFQLTFRDGSVVSFGTGNAVDFLDLPPDRSPRDIVAVTPHAGREDPTKRCALDYAWCLFSS